MNPIVNIEVSATVEWNGLEATILKHLYDAEEYPVEAEYTLQEMITLNGDLGREMHPENPNKVPGQLRDRDNCGTYIDPVRRLFDKTETLIANMERADILGEEFEYDEDAEL